jgi:hypothetical protein
VRHKRQNIFWGGGWSDCSSSVRGKRDDPLPTLGMGKRPACSSVRPCSPAPDRLPIVLPKLSKLLNQEDALGAPWIRTVICALRRRCRRGGKILRTGVIRRFPCHIRVCYTQVIMRAGADASRWLAAYARAE